MSDPQREPDSSPYSRPPERASTPTTESAQKAIIAGTVGLTGALALAGFLVYRSATAAPPAAVEDAPPPMPAPAAAPAPRIEAPKPAIAMVETDPKAKLKSCRPYAGFVADQQNPAVGEDALADEARCLCSLAGGFTVRTRGNGLQVYKRVSSCPSGSKPVPLEPDAKVWMGSWIDEPGHGACVCSESARALKAVFADGP
jgi:hypothetical protein